MRSAAKKTASSGRSYGAQTLKLLWGRAAGRCAVPTCRVELIVGASEHDPVVLIGDIAHIQAASDDGPRANLALSGKERDSYDNLILLCKNCHSKLDGQKNTHSVAFIQHLKHNHEAWVRASLPERGKSKTGWKTLLLRAEHPVDQTTFDAALAPDYIEGTVIEINATPSPNGWNSVADTIRGSLIEVLGNTSLEESRFAVFPLAPVSASIYLGYCMTNRPRVQLFQYDRDRQTWARPLEVQNRVGVSVSTMKPNSNASDIAFLFQLSARIDARFSHNLPPNTLIISIGIDHPRTNWLCHSRQLQELGRTSRQVFEDCMNELSGVEKWHVFYAGPAPGAVVVGQQLNPTMTPPVQLYEFRHPQHVPSLLISPTMDACIHVSDLSRERMIGANEVGGVSVSDTH